MTLGIGLLCLLAGGAAIFTVAALLRWLSMSLGAKDGFGLGLVLGALGHPGHVPVSTALIGTIAAPQRSSVEVPPGLGRP
jgi:hypothetical protein